VEVDGPATEQPVLDTFALETPVQPVKGAELIVVGDPAILRAGSLVA
jgi:hypothetical protein